MSISKSQHKNRIHYIDVAKGILILFVIIGHVSWKAECNKIHNIFFSHVDDIVFLWLSFFMAAFFVITGYCSNFEKRYKSFLITDIRSLLVPSVLLVALAIVMRHLTTGVFDCSGLSFYQLSRFISCHWFLPALFWAKQLHFFCRKVNKVNVYVRTVIYLLLGFLGVWLSSQVIDYWWMWHSMMFVIFLHVGEQLKKQNYMRILDNKYACIACVLPYVLYVLIMKICVGKIPTITSRVSLEMNELPLFYMSAMMGTLFIIYCSKKISESKILEYFGKQSLVFYCMHFIFMDIFFSTFIASLNSMNINKSILSFIIMMFFVIGSCSLFAWILNKKCLSWMIGK